MKTRTVRWLHYIAICLGLAFIVWSLLQHQSYMLSKDIGVEGVGQITTEQVPAGSFVYVHATSTKKMDTRLVRDDNRDLVYVGNNSYYDRHLDAGGPPGNGVGTDVTLMPWPAQGPTTYTITIKAPSDVSIDYTEADVKYDVNVDIWTPDWSLLVIGFVVVSATFTMGTVLGIGLFGPGAYRPRSREEMMAQAREVPPVRAPAPVQARPTEIPEQYVARPPTARQAGPPPRVPEPEAEFGPRYEVRVEDEAPPAPAPRRGEPVWDMAPTRVERPAPAPEPGKPLKKIKCSACGAIIPVYSAERPLRVTCPLCGRQGTLQR
jgi:hypothetical protein